MKFTLKKKDNKPKSGDAVVCIKTNTLYLIGNDEDATQYRLVKFQTGYIHPETFVEVEELLNYHFPLGCRIIPSDKLEIIEL